MYNAIPMIRILIVEDDPIVAKDISLIVTGMGHFLIGNVGSISEARILISGTKPDLILLDIELKDGIAFDLLSELSSEKFHIIFITAHNHYAVKAIKFGAFDYLMKPFDEEELANALNKLTNQPQVHQIQSRIAQESLQGQHTQNKIVLRSQNYLQVVNFDNILYCEGDGSYTHFYLADKRKVTTSHSIKEYEDLLPESWFIRSHHSFLVNHRYIDGLHKDGYLVIQGGIEVPVSTRRKEFVKKCLLGESRG
jgi:two-component system, LytTR family, response regulator